MTTDAPAPEDRDPENVNPDQPKFELTPDSQPALPPEPEDLTLYDRFLEVQSYRNVIRIKNSHLLSIFMQVFPFCDDLHKRALKELDQRVSDNRSHGKDDKFLARTSHHQLYTIIKRYVPKIAEANELELAEQVRLAVLEAEKIGNRARQKYEEILSSRNRDGNVKFVKSLKPPKTATT